MTATLAVMGITGVSPIHPVNVSEGLLGPAQKFYDWAAKAASGALHSLEDVAATGWDKVKDWVCFWNWTSPTTSSSFSMMASTSLSLDSLPGQVLVTDSAGRRVGSDGINTYAEIPGAIYLADGSNGMVILPWTFDAGQLSGVQVTAMGSGQEFQGWLASSDSGQVSSQSLGGGVLDQGYVEESVTVRIGVGAAKAVIYQDADGSYAKVTVKNGTALIGFSGENLSQTFAKGVVTVTGTNLGLSQVNLDNTTGKSQMAISVTGGDGLVSIGTISGSAILGSLSAKKVDLTGQGIILTGQGYIGTLQLHGLLDGADIDMPGTGASKGVSLSLGPIEADGDITCGSFVKSLTATNWASGTLTAPWASRIAITGGPKGIPAGICGADIDLTSGDAKGLALGSFTAAGAVSGTWTLAGGAGAVNMGATGGAWTASFGSDAEGWANVKSITARLGDLSCHITANSVGTLSVKGSLESAALDLKRGPDAKLQALGKLTAGTWIDASQITSAGTIGSVTAGGIRNSTIFAGVETTRDDQGVGGVGDGVWDLPELADLTTPLPVTNLVASIKSLSVKGVKEAGVFEDSFINSNIAASSLGRISLCYAKFDNDGNTSAHDVPFGLACLTLSGLSYKDADVTHKYAWKPADSMPVWFDDLLLRL